MDEEVYNEKVYKKGYNIIIDFEFSKIKNYIELQDYLKEKILFYEKKYDKELMIRPFVFFKNEDDIKDNYRKIGNNPYISSDWSYKSIYVNSLILAIKSMIKNIKRKKLKLNKIIIRLHNVPPLGWKYEEIGFEINYSISTKELLNKIKEENDIEKIEAMKIAYKRIDGKYRF